MNLQISGLKVDIGEGTRGGRVIGRTSSGKPIYSSANHPDHKEFTKKEHFEAQRVHENEAMKFLERSTSSKTPPEYHHFSSEAAKHYHAAKRTK